MSDDTSRNVALGWHDDKRMADDYKLVDEYLKMEKPYDVKTAYTNEFLDKNVKMPPINPPKLSRHCSGSSRTSAANRPPNRCARRRRRRSLSRR